MGKKTKSSYKRGDRFTKQAREQGYQARSVFKLEEIDRRFKLLSRGQTVVDLGCYPGSWSRYAAERVGRTGMLVGVDLEEAQGIEGRFWVGSVYDVTAEQLLELADGQVDVLLSDMAPRTTGDRFGDHVRQIELVNRAQELMLQVLKPGGSFVAKVFEGQDAQGVINGLRPHFGKVKRVKPEAVRQKSVEFFVVCTAFKGA
jgi:23S rRNA (uridine2552-2'-O)-methyltransferase